MQCPKCGQEMVAGEGYGLSLAKAKQKGAVIPQKLVLRATKQFVCGGCDTEVRTHEDFTYNIVR